MGIYTIAARSPFSLFYNYDRIERYSLQEGKGESNYDKFRKTGSGAGLYRRRNRAAGNDSVQEKAKKGERA